MRAATRLGEVGDVGEEMELFRECRPPPLGDFGVGGAEDRPRAALWAAICTECVPAARRARLTAPSVRLNVGSDILLKR